MRALVVDDSRLAASSLARVVASIDPQGSCTVVHSAKDALKVCKDTMIEVAFLDIEMPGANGLTLARHLKVTSPLTNVVFVTGYPEYALDAWYTQASAFLVKPVDEASVRRSLESLRVPLNQDVDFDKGLFVQCFGNFEVFYDGVPLSFERTHTKELLAYLVDRRGSFVSNGELMGVLWENMPDTASRRSQLRTLIADLRRTLAGVGHGQAVVGQRGGLAINLATEECDYYGFIRGVPKAVNRYRGEYMRQYSWAEATAALLDSDQKETSRWRTFVAPMR